MNEWSASNQSTHPNKLRDMSIIQGVKWKHFLCVPAALAILRHEVVPRVPVGVKSPNRFATFFSSLYRSLTLYIGNIRTQRTQRTIKLWWTLDSPLIFDFRYCGMLSQNRYQQLHTGTTPSSDKSNTIFQLNTSLICRLKCYGRLYSPKKKNYDLDLLGLRLAFLGEKRWKDSQSINMCICIPTFQKLHHLSIVRHYQRCLMVRSTWYT